MDDLKVAYLQLHLAVILYGLTAILGDLISIPSVPLVWWRVFITVISLLVFIKFGKSILAIPRRRIFALLGIGVIVAIHWVTFYGAIKYSTASVALILLSLVSFFTSVLEPLLLRTKFNGLQMIFGILVIPGMFLVVQGIDQVHMVGVYLGLISALGASIFTVLNKLYVEEVEAFSMTFLEMFGVLITLTLIYPFIPGKYFTPFVPVGIDWIYLLILALACTTFAFYLSLIALKKMSAFEANLIINLEPVYGILLAIVILKEHKELDAQFYFGVLIILAAVFLYPVVKKLRGKHGS